MPWQQRDVVQFCLILLCVPLQYYLCGFFEDVKDNDRSQIIMSVMKNVDSIKEKLFNVNLWTLNWHELVLWAFADFFTESSQDDNDTNDGPKEKVEDNNGSSDNDVEFQSEEHDYMAQLSKVRSIRPDMVLYRVGQTIQLLDHAYRGVIVGWEYNEKMDSEPVYTVLIDESHTKSDMLSVVIEVNQTKFYLIRHHQVSHKYLRRYFSLYDGSQYIPKKWLRRLYPKD